MLWVDLSKCFLTFSRAAGQFLQARRGVPVQVRKAVWNLYSTPSPQPLTPLNAFERLVFPTV